MAQTPFELPDKAAGQLVNLLESRATDFVGLTRDAGLDPAADFVGANLRGLSFQGEDLSTFNFDHADLSGCDFTGAVALPKSWEGSKTDGAKGLPAVAQLQLEENDLPDDPNEEAKKLLLAEMPVPQPWEGYVTTLNLSSTGFHRVDLLRPLLNLRHLHLWDTQVVDISPLEALTSITRLDLRKTRISDITPLARMIRLETLDLSSTLVRDISPLKELTTLVNLYLPTTPLSDLTPLKNLSALDTLFLFDAPIRDITPLKNLRALRWLDLRGTQVNDWDPVNHIDKVFGRSNNWDRKEYARG